MEVPAEALREALINALCHRQYEKYNLTIGIAIYDDRIEIESPGVLPPQLTTETIKQPHISYPYNPIIADVLFKTTFLENWGSGAGRIMDACKNQNVEAPIWTIQGGFVIVTFKRPITANSTQATPSTPQAPPKYPSSTPQVEELIKVVDDQFIDRSSMMKLVQLQDRKHFRENYLLIAIKEGAIESKYPEQPNHPKQQYRLTEKALEWKRNHK